MLLQVYTRDGSIFSRDDLCDEPWGPFMMVMTLCHSVQVSEGKLAASSPDEKALLDVCSDSGFVFRGQQPPTNADGFPEVEVEVKGVPMRFAVLAELEFDSFRKCMTVVVRDLASGVVHVLCKGAEVAVVPACHAGPIDRTERVVNGFAADGLRTLVRSRVT